MNTELSRKNETTPTRAGEPRAPRPPESRITRPRVDVFENATEYLVVADLPGVPREALTVSFDDGELRIAAKRGDERPGQPLAMESGAADYERAFAMPDGIDAEAIAAQLANGVLRVRLPKSAARQARKIDVRAG